METDCTLSAILLDCARDAETRFDLWARFMDSRAVVNFAEVGVWKGEFAEFMLGRCPGLRRYYLVDSWRHLSDWNRPWNLDDRALQECYEETLRRTAFAADRTVLLRDTTLEAVKRIPDSSLDAAYIDGDHTLRGITIDLINILPKVRPGGWVFGDDFYPKVSHHLRHEPILVFPFAVHFAEAMRLPIYALPFRQFLIHNEPSGFVFHDASGEYRERELRRHLSPGIAWRLRAAELRRRVAQVGRRLLHR